MKKISDYLEKLGLSRAEAEIYYSLLKHGPTTVMHIAEHTGFNRVTTHFHIESLIAKGLASQIKKETRRRILAEPPERLMYLIEQKENNLRTIKKDFVNFINTIHEDFPTARSLYEEIEVHYYKGKKGVQQVYNDVLRAKEMRSYVNAKEIAKVFPDNMKRFISTHQKRKDMMIWEILNKSSIVEEYARNMASGRYCYKFIPPLLNLSTIDHIIYDGKVAIINIRENPTGMIITNKDYYDNAKAIFDYVWNTLPDHL